MRPFIIWFLILGGFAIPATAPLLWVLAALLACRMVRDFRAARRGETWLEEEAGIVMTARAFGDGQ